MMLRTYRTSVVVLVYYNAAYFRIYQKWTIRKALDRAFRAVINICKASFPKKGLSYVISTDTYIATSLLRELRTY